jgi:hypothetical protein
MWFVVDDGEFRVSLTLHSRHFLVWFRAFFILFVTVSSTYLFCYIIHERSFTNEVVSHVQSSSFVNRATAPTRRTFAAESRAHLHKDIPTNWNELKNNIWLSDPGAYPVLFVLTFAVGFCGSYMTVSCEMMMLVVIWLALNNCLLTLCFLTLIIFSS